MSARKSDPSSDAAFALLVADVYELAGALRRHGESIAATAGQTQARWQLLSVVSDGSWTVPGAARRLGITRQAVQRVADDLVADGLAELVDNPAHRRSPILQLTPAGRRSLAAMTEASNRWQRSVAADLAADGLERARRVLRDVLELVRD